MAIRGAAAGKVSLAVDFAGQVAGRAHAALARAPARRFSIGGAQFDILTSPLGHEQLSRAFLQGGRGQVREGVHSIFVWDGTDPRVGPPHRPWGETGHEPLGVVAAYSDSRIRCAFDIHTSSLIVHDRERHCSYTWYPDIASLPAWAKASPFRIPLSWLLNRHEMQMVHGAAVAIDGSAVLLAGAGGSGKSTTALACALAGMGYLGDDYCAVDPQRRTVHMIYRTAKAFPRTLGMLPRLNRLVVNADRITEEKGVIFFEADDLNLIHSAGLAAILLPRISIDGRTAVTPASRADAMRALLPSTVGGLMGGTGFTPKALLKLVHDIPVFTMDLGTDLAAVIDAVSSVIERWR
ncbi:MAG TPA: hypothetical protein VFG64_02740 [Dongiaceae bacterium]|nr:hypothetical protein [Dongiaceae bacterium]